MDKSCGELYLLRPFFHSYQWGAKGSIIPQRGLRQGCPLSPYLFLICSEALSSLINNAEAKNKPHGLKVNLRSLSISHLLFADDSLIFLRANKEEGTALKNILQLYEAASGQKVNFQKSALSVSPGTSQDVIDDLKAIFEREIVSCHSQYLGLPSTISRNKKNVFAHIKKRVNKKVGGWNDRLFSGGGKEVLIKSVIQAIPTYLMSIFKLSVGICKDIENMANDFWWGKTKDKRKLHWRSWERLSKAKSEGFLASTTSKPLIKPCLPSKVGD